MSADDRDKRLRKLAEHDPEQLAKLLLDLGDDRVRDEVERLVTTASEAGARARRRLAALRRDQTFHTYRHASDFADELLSIVADIKAATTDPREGVGLVTAFYLCDDAVFRRSDDSGGQIGDIFRHDAARLFRAFASRAEDKEWLVNMLARLLADDGYGVRDSVLDDAGSYLPEPAIRLLIDKLRERSAVRDGYAAKSPLIQAAALARQLSDPSLFEALRRAANDGELYPAALKEIAEIHLDLDDAESALEWATSMPDERFRADEKRELLLRIHRRLGNRGEAEQIAWATFREHRSTESLASLLAVVGEEEREQAIEDAQEIINATDTWNVGDAGFLFEVGRIAEAEAYVLRLRQQLNGDFYTGILWLAQSMEDERRFVTGSVLYRSLLESILRRAKSKYYGHGARYLKTLDALAKKVRDWGDVENHRSYRRSLAEQHARKHAFWRRVPR